MIVLKYLDSDLIVESKAKKLTQLEIKAVAKTILEALRVLHEGGYVHTGSLVFPMHHKTLADSVQISSQTMFSSVMDKKPDLQKSSSESVAEPFPPTLNGRKEAIQWVHPFGKALKSSWVFPEDHLLISGHLAYW